VVKFVAIAIRFGVMNRGVMVDQLRAVRGVKAVHRAFAAFRIENRDDVVPCNGCSERNGMREEIAVSLLVRLDGCDVKRVGVFVLNLAMLKARAFREDQFGHGIREMNFFAK
jgi:hypothetical protein